MDKEISPIRGFSISLLFAVILRALFWVAELAVPLHELGLRGGWVSIYCWVGVFAIIGFLIYAFRLSAMSEPAKMLAKGWFAVACGPVPLVAFSLWQIYAT
jgi:hypothetical protein